MGKRVMVAIVFIPVFFLVAATALMAATGSYDFRTRIDDQQSSIDAGISSGKLTRAEADVVQDNLNWIKIRYERLTADGRLSNREMETLDRMLDDNTRMIRREKGDVRRVYDVNIESRITNQQKSIDNGIRSGRLTRSEAAVLQDNLNWIRSQYSQLRADGKLNSREWERLDSMLDQNGYMITKEKKDAARRLY